MQKSKHTDEVARNQIWREHCRKEASQLKSSSNFSVPNPSKMHILPPKPNRTVPKFVKQTDGQDMLEATTLLLTICNAKHTHELPNETFKLPPTSNTEYGFCYKPLQQGHPMFRYNRTKCDVTAYADEYCTTDFPLSSAHHHLHLPFPSDRLAACICNQLHTSTHGENPFAKKSGGSVSAKH